MKRSTFVKLAAGLMFAAVGFSAAAQVVNNDRSNVLIVNRSSTAVYYIYASDSSDSSYSRLDLLTRPNKTGSAPGVILSGGSEFVNFSQPNANSCSQDVLAIGEDGRKWRWTMDVCRISTHVLGE